MKLDICEKVSRHSELCSDIKFCCKMMKSMVIQHHIDIDVLEYGPVTRLFINDARDYGRYFPYIKDQDIIDIHYAVNINYCPFCGERIEQTEKRSSPI